MENMIHNLVQPLQRMQPMKAPRHALRIFQPVVIKHHP